jgi:hypothetical protein
MKTVFRVESASEENVRGGWYLVADSLAAARDVYPAQLFPSMTLVEVGEGMCVECNRRAVDALVEER